MGTGSVVGGISVNGLDPRHPTRRKPYPTLQSTDPRRQQKELPDFGVSGVIRHGDQERVEVSKTGIGYR